MSVKKPLVNESNYYRNWKDYLKENKMSRWGKPRKNTKRIDPRYFMDEKTERSSTIELTEGLFNRMFGGDKEEEEESGSSGYALSPGSTGGPTMKLTRSGMDYIKGLVKTDPRTARALVTILSPETADQYGISQEERDELRKHLTYTDRLEYMNNM